METTTIIAVIAGLISLISLILHILGYFIKTIVSYLIMTKEASEYEQKIFKSPVAVSTTDIAIATGNQLNQWAYLHGLERNENETDDELRIRIMSVRKKMEKK